MPDPQTVSEIENDNIHCPEEEEESLIFFDDEDVEEGLHVCKNSMVGKIITEKPIHKNYVQSALANIWCNPKGFQIEEIEGKLYQISFDEEKYAKES